MSFRPPSLRTMLVILGLLVCIVALAMIVSLFDAATQKRLLREGGVIESMSAAGYVLAAALLILWIGRSGNRLGWPLAGLLLVMAGRELDLDKRPFTLGLFKSREYISPEVPLAEKLIALAILLGIVLLLVLAARRYGARLLTGLRTGEAPAWYVATGVLLVVLSKSIDGIGRKLAPIGVTVSDSAEQVFSMYEEIAELGIPIAFILAIGAASRQSAGAGGTAPKISNPERTGPRTRTGNNE